MQTSGQLIEEIPQFKDIIFPLQLFKMFRLQLKFEIPAVFACCLQAKTVGISNFNGRFKTTEREK